MTKPDVQGTILRMLLLCSGDDSFRSLEKARELESAFRQKYDPTGSAVDRLPSGKEGVESFLVASTGGSLFSPRRFFRVDGLLSSCPKARVDALVSALERDVENNIVVSVEEGELTEKMLKPFSKIQKLIHYTFPFESASSFMKWATEFAKKQGVSDISTIKQIADSAGGDSWIFVNELQKWRAGGSLTLRGSTSPTVYDVIDQLLMHRPSRWSSVRAFDDANAVVASVITQARSLLLVRSGHATGVHPYVAQKLSRLQTTDPAETYVRLATAFAWSRTSMGNADEMLDVMG
jgi:hypothetical protein